MQLSAPKLRASIIVRVLSQRERNIPPQLSKAIQRNICFFEMPRGHPSFIVAIATLKTF